MLFGWIVLAVWFAFVAFWLIRQFVTGELAVKE